MKDWRGVPIRISDKVVWASRGYGNSREQRFGVVTRVNEEKKLVTVRRLEPEIKSPWEIGAATLPYHRVTRVDELPLPRDEDGCVGLDAI